MRRHIQFYASQTKNGNDFSSGRRVSFLNLRLSTLYVLPDLPGRILTLRDNCSNGGSAYVQFHR
jgi:hypothetical protein